MVGEACLAVAVERSVVQVAPKQSRFILKAFSTARSAGMIFVFRASIGQVLTSDGRSKTVQKDSNFLYLLTSRIHGMFVLVELIKSSSPEKTGKPAFLAINLLNTVRPSVWNSTKHKWHQAMSSSLKILR